LAIIQGIQAAWGAIQRIIQAISAFVAFLKGVLSGSGPVLFAQAVAAAAVAVIEFVAQWLLKKLKGAATGVGGKLREIAKRIGQRLKAVGKAVAGGARRAAGAAMRAVRAVGRGIAHGARAVGRGIARGARYLERKLGRFGAAMGRGIRGAAAAMKRQWQRLKDKFREWRDKLKQKWENWKKKREERKAQKAERAQEKLDQAVAAIRPQLQSLLMRGVSAFRLRAQLLYWRARYRLTSLTISQGMPLTITATVNPKLVVAHAVKVLGGELGQILNEVGNELMQDAAIRGEIEQINRDRQAGLGRVDPETHTAPAGPRAVQSPAAEAASIHGAEGGQQRPRAQSEDLEILPGVVVRERQTRTSSYGHIETYGMGGHNRYRHDVQQRLRDMRRAGLSDSELRDAMFAVMGRRRPDHPVFQGPGGEELLRRLAAVTRLVAAVEPGRHPPAHATTFMGWSLLGDSDVTSAQVVTYFNPMSAKGASGQATKSRVPEAVRTAAIERDAQKHLRREVWVTVAYIEMLVRTEQLVFSSTADCVRWIREKFKAHLLTRLRTIMWPGE
jgi:hypothetical protein